MHACVRVRVYAGMRTRQVGAHACMHVPSVYDLTRQTTAVDATTLLILFFIFYNFCQCLVHVSEESKRERDDRDISIGRYYQQRNVNIDTHEFFDGRRALEASDVDADRSARSSTFGSHR